MSRTRDTADLVTLNALNAEGGRVGIGTTAKSNQLTVEGNALVTGVTTFSSNVVVSGDLTVSGTTEKESLSVTNAEVTGVATVKTNNVTNSNITNLVVSGVSTLGVVTSVTSIQATKFYGDGSALTGISAGVSTANVSTNTLNVVGLSTFSGIVTTTGDLYVGGTLYVEGDTEKTDIVVSGIGTIGTLEVGGPVQSVGVSTNYAQVTITGQSPSSLNETYTRQSTGFTLDTGTIASGNALFHADSNYYYYVATTGFDAEDKIIIWSVEDNSWHTIYNFNDPDYREGNITNNQALGSSGIFADSLTGSTITDGGRNIPQASSDIVYTSSGGGTTGGIGATLTSPGNAVFAGIVTAASNV